VIGSGIMGERLASGNIAIALLANSLATGGGLVVLILIFGPVSGAHFNRAVTLAAATQGVLPWRGVFPYIAIQVLGAFAGVAAAHGMFGEPLFVASLKVRTSGAQWWSEFVATFGLLMVIWGCVRQQITAVPYAVAAYITAPIGSPLHLVRQSRTIARAASNTFAGIRPTMWQRFCGATPGPQRQRCLRWCCPQKRPMSSHETQPCVAVHRSVRHHHGLGAVSAHGAMRLTDLTS
jgi:glycerol uptake facilitator-like aquaporin